MADAVEYAEILNTAARQAGYPEEFENPASFAGKTTNWWDAGIRQFTPQLNASLGVQGGTEKNKYSVSLNYFSKILSTRREDISDLQLVLPMIINLISIFQLDSH